MTRYLLAIVPPHNIQAQLRDIYQQTYLKPCPVRTLHCTFIPPFVLKKGYTPQSLKQMLADVPAQNDQFQLGTSGIFALKSRKIMYVHVLPAEPLQKIYDAIINATKPMIEIETKAFKENKLPQYLPHITLNYNFKGDVTKFIPPTDTFEIPAPELLFETGPGFWRPVP